MKAILEFNLPEDGKELYDHMRMHLYRKFYNELYDEVFRPVIKYGNDAAEVEGFELVWEKISEFIKELEN